MARVLIVEDSLTVVSTVEALLRKYGHTVYSTRDGLMALTALRAFVPEIVLLDILLPHIDGIELCSLIRKQPVYESVSIIMMTGLKDDETVQRAYDAGANHYLSKPFTEEQFYSLLHPQNGNGSDNAPSGAGLLL